jgi:hypothetical protein
LVKRNRSDPTATFKLQIAAGNAHPLLSYEEPLNKELEEQTKGQRIQVKELWLKNIKENSKRLTESRD